MRIDIVTPAFNVAPYIGDAIRSVLAQTHLSWTMTIVDDGSTDETSAVAATFDDPRLRLLHQSNAGVSAARNLGLAAAGAEAVLFLDADDWLAPEALSSLATTLRTAPNAIAAVGPYRRVHDWAPGDNGDRRPGAGSKGDLDGDRHRGSGDSRVWRPVSGDLLELLLIRNMFANGGHLLIRRHALEAAGPFNPSLVYGEDWELWIRLACLGPFVATDARAPLLFVRERHDSAYRGMASRPESFGPCMDAIFCSTALISRFGAAPLAHRRRRAEAENDWIIGRELIRHGKLAEGRGYLRRSVAAAPSLRRLVLLAAAYLPMVRVGPFRSYPMPDPV